MSETHFPNSPCLAPFELLSPSLPNFNLPLLLLSASRDDRYVSFSMPTPLSWWQSPRAVRKDPSLSENECHDWWAMSPQRGRGHVRYACKVFAICALNYLL